MIQSSVYVTIRGPVSADEQIPTEVVRDLIAIAQLVHQARKREGAAPLELSKLEAANNAFLTCLALAERVAAGGSPAAAWGWAERGLAWLAAALCKEDASATVFVSAWGTRLRKKQR